VSIQTIYVYAACNRRHFEFDFIHLRYGSDVSLKKAQFLTTKPHSHSWPSPSSTVSDIGIISGKHQSDPSQTHVPRCSLWHQSSSQGSTESGTVTDSESSSFVSATQMRPASVSGMYALRHKSPSQLWCSGLQCSQVIQSLTPRSVAV